MSTPEGKVKAQIKKYLKTLKAYWFLPVSNGMGAHGIPDIIACVPTVITQDMVGKEFGLFVGIEVKKPGRRGEKNAGASALQMVQIGAINTAGGKAGVCDCVEQVEELLI